MTSRDFFGARATVVAMACVLGAADVVVLVALAEADRAVAAVRG